MIRTPKILPFIFIFFSLTQSSTKIDNLHSTLTEYYDDGSEMNQRIIIEFINSDYCQKKC